VPNGRRFGHVLSSEVVNVHMCGREREKEVEQGDENGVVDSENGPARAEVRSFLQRAAIPSKGVIFLHSQMPHMQLL
jgi:hypothetical protein